MSVQVSAWVWRLRLNPTLKVVLLALADQSDDEGKCWPSIRYIAEKCCTSERTIQRALRHFESENLLRISSRFKEGRQGSNYYQLLWQKMEGCRASSSTRRLERNKNAPDNLSPHSSADTPPPDIGVTPGVTLTTSMGDSDVTQTTSEPSLETLQQPPKHSVLAYPPQIGATEKRSITKLLQQTPTDQAQLILDELHGMLERGKIRSAPLYVRALVERNRLNEFVPAAGISITARRNKVTQETSTEQRPDATNRETGMQALQELRKRNTRKT
jgi:hypothetical protein